jgi:hypothetical protein
MIELEPRGNEWAVIQKGELVSLHPTRAEAVRAALWLQRADRPKDTLYDDNAHDHTHS